MLCASERLRKDSAGNGSRNTRFRDNDKHSMLRYTHSRAIYVPTPLASNSNLEIPSRFAFETTAPFAQITRAAFTVHPSWSMTDVYNWSPYEELRIQSRRLCQLSLPLALGLRGTRADVRLIIHCHTGSPSLSSSIMSQYMTIAVAAHDTLMYNWHSEIFQSILQTNMRMTLVVSAGSRMRASTGFNADARSRPLD